MKEENLMSKKEVAEYLSVSTKTIERLVQRGELPQYKIGKTVRYKKEDVEKYLESIKEVGGE